MKTPILLISSAALAAFFCMTLIRGCFLTIIPAKICGFDLTRPPAEFRKLTRADASVTSGIPESKEFSVNRDTTAEKLIDGSVNTLAQPGGNKIDYEVTLVNPSEIKEMAIYWKDYGVNANYISKWSVESSENGADWTPVGGGDSPHDEKTVIDKKFTASKIRLRARSAKDWIGAYEMEIIARPL